MCFGPVASFTSAAVLTTAGAVTLKTARSRNELLFAAFPLLFGVQQFIEGLIWLGVHDGPLLNYRRPLAALFLLFAYILWPVLSPLAVYLLEPKRKIRIILTGFIVAGILTAGYLVWFAITYPHQINVIGHSIQYHTKKFSTATGIFYLGSTYIPYLLSSHRGIVTLGVLNILFAAISRYFYWTTFDSVWCFFAAALSLGIFFFLRSPRKSI
jgi:hypothetical protein